MSLPIEILEQFFGAYLHQDWMEEFDTDVQAIDEIIRNNPREFLLAAEHEIINLIESNMSETELERMMLYDFGCFYDPSAEGLTYREWLRKVADRLRSAR